MPKSKKPAPAVRSQGGDTNFLSVIALAAFVERPQADGQIGACILFRPESLKVPA